MSSIGTPRRIEPVELVARMSLGAVATVLACLLLTVALVSFRPFDPGDSAGAAQTGGDIVNQLGFGSLGVLAIFTLLCLADRRAVASLLSPWWAILIGLFLLSVVNAGDPAGAMRAASFTIIGILIMCALLTAPKSADDFSVVLAVAAIVVLVLSYTGIVALPALAKHTADSIEPQHDGLWRGVFSHKNIAGPVMACFAFAGLYLLRRGWKWLGGLIFLAAIVFMLNTGSKTTVGLIPLAMLIVAAPNIIGLRIAVPVLFAAAVTVTALGTLGTVFIEPLKQLAATLFEDPSFTGRTTLWQFIGDMIARRPWTGYGFESFWGTPVVNAEDFPFDREWDVRGAVHGHNGYLDIALLMGVPTLAAFVVACLLVPLRDYMRVPLTRENVYLADFFMMCLLFTVLNGFLESFFFRRVDPVWLFFVMSVFGLRLVARVKIRPHRGS